MIHRIGPSCPHILIRYIPHQDWSSKGTHTVHLPKHCILHVTKNQSYDNIMHVQGPILWDSACSYMYLCTVSSEGSVSCMKDKLCGNSTCTKCSVKRSIPLQKIPACSVKRSIPLQKIPAYRELNQWSVKTCT